MTTTTAMTKLVCAECGHENEAERIYCHNCGERLDRSAVSAQKKAQDPQEVHRRLQKMLGPPNMARRHFFTVSKLALAAAVVAALVEIALPPELPAPTRPCRRKWISIWRTQPFIRRLAPSNIRRTKSTPISLID